MKIFNNLLILFFITVIITSCNNNKSVKENKEKLDSAKYKTIEKLKIAINGETTASKKYLAFSKKAEKEGYSLIAKLFLAVSKSESIHAKNHSETLKKYGYMFSPTVSTFEIKSTEENLKNAIEGENYEITQMYPEFIKVAEDEKLPDAKGSLTWAMMIEIKHKTFYQNALQAITVKNESTLPGQYYICPKCGNTFCKQTLVDYCELCMTYKGNFIYFM